MLRTVLLILVALTVVSLATKWELETNGYTFEEYISDFRKTYQSEKEHNERKGIFYERVKMIIRHNRDPRNTWKMAVNQFADHTHEELKIYRGVRKGMLYHSRSTKSPSPLPFAPLKAKDLPDRVDWREKGVVTPVKDQGRCGSCWSFASAETIESTYALATGKLVELSQQRILDCTPNPQHCGGTGGCSGATAELAFDQVKKNGIPSEWTYPYRSYYGADYQCDSRPPAFSHIKDYVILPSNQQDPLMTAVATVGPIAISVDASNWHFYGSGVFDSCNQTTPDIDHAVQLVGYGTDDMYGDYWLVRNSWSPTWGEAGYIRIKRETTPRCGTDITPQDGSGCDGGPPTVEVCGTCGILYDSTYTIFSS
jgi:cathepsin L